MENKFRVNDLVDFYGALLTEKQREIAGYYYKEDFSLLEISEITGSSRAAVHDMIKRIRNELEKYEASLHMLEAYEKRRGIYEKIRALGNEKIDLLIDQLIETEIS